IDSIGKEYETKTNENGEFFYQFTSPSKVGKYLVNISVNSGEFHGIASDYLEVKRQEYPNVVVRDISISPSTPYIGEKVQISVVVQNKGKENATNVLIDIFVDDLLVGEDEKSVINPDATAFSNSTWKAKKGSHNVTVKINGVVSQINKSFKVIEKSSQSLIPQNMGIFVVLFVIVCAAIFVYISSKEKNTKFTRIRKIMKRTDKSTRSTSVVISHEKEND
ncbi:MAG: CARDB domain-containing protein, partial [Thermoplasmata archaeon]